MRISKAHIPFNQRLGKRKLGKFTAMWQVTKCSRDNLPHFHHRLPWGRLASLEFETLVSERRRSTLPHQIFYPADAQVKTSGLGGGKQGVMGLGARRKPTRRLNHIRRPKQKLYWACKMRYPWEGKQFAPRLLIVRHPARHTKWSMLTFRETMLRGC